VYLYDVRCRNARATSIAHRRFRPAGGPQWPAGYCQPEGFMRRFAQYSSFSPHVMVTPDLAQILNATVKNFMTHVHIGRRFSEEGPGVPRLGPPVPRWYGETVGFWDGEALVTWTSNIQRT
jgi:hypothetical protein